jgi:hypothetical protein
VCAPLRLGGLRGKKSTPSEWLGGTGEFVMVGKQDGTERVDNPWTRRTCKGTPFGRMKDSVMIV